MSRDIELASAITQLALEVLGGRVRLSDEEARWVAERLHGVETRRARHGT